MNSHDWSGVKWVLFWVGFLLIGMDNSRTPTHLQGWIAFAGLGCWILMIPVHNRIRRLRFNSKYPEDGTSS